MELLSIVIPKNSKFFWGSKVILLPVYHEAYLVEKENSCIIIIYYFISLYFQLVYNKSKEK